MPTLSAEKFLRFLGQKYKNLTHLRNFKFRVGTREPWRSRHLAPLGYRRPAALGAVAALCVSSRRGHSFIFHRKRSTLVQLTAAAADRGTVGENST